MKGVLIKDSIAYGLTGVASRFAGVLLIPVYTRLLDSSEYGLLDLLITLGAILNLLACLQAESGIARFFHEKAGREDKGVLVGTGLAIYCAGALAVTLLAAALFASLGSNRGLPFSWEHILPLLVQLFPGQLVGLWLLLFRLSRRQTWHAIVAVGDVTVSGLLGVVFVVYLDGGVPGVLWGLALSKLAWSLVAAWPLRSQLTIRFDPGTARQILTFCFPFVPTVVVQWLQTQGNRAILVAFLTLSEVGIFAIAVKLAMLAGLAIEAFKMAWVPYAMERINEAGAESDYSRVLANYLALMFAACGLLGAAAYIAVKVLATDAYIEAGQYVGLIAMGLLWSGAGAILGVGIHVAKSTWFFFWAQTVGMLANAVLLVSAVTHLGILSAALAFMLGSLASTSAIYYFAQRLNKFAYSKRLLGTTAVCSLLLPIAYALMPVPEAGLHELLLDGGKRVLVATPAMLLVYWLAVRS